MPTAPGVVSDFTAIQREDGTMQTLTPAPAAPAPAPAPVVAAQPVVTKPRMIDEAPDGSVRDTSMEAMRPGNDLNFRRVDEDIKPSSPKQEEKPAEAATPPAEAAPPASPEPQKLYAGKFKTAEELEKSYKEAEAALTRKSQEAAELAKKLEQPTTPPTPAQPTPQELAAKAKRNEEFLAKFVADPEKVVGEYHERAQQQMQIALQSQKMQEDWRKANPDLEPHEFYVSAEAWKLAQSDPELAKNPEALLSKATENFRQVFGAIRTAGAKEALTTETRVTPLLSSTASAPATEQPAKAPLTADQAYDLTMQMLKDQERRSHQGLRR